MNTLRLGKRGPGVKRWQFFLVGQGFNPGKADGVFGPQTEEATKQFQAKYGLVADGLAGNQTFGQAMLLGFKMMEDPKDERTEGPNWPPEPDFSPLMNTAARQAIFGKFAYESAPTSDEPDGIRILGGWEQRNIIAVEIPQLKGVKGAPKTGRIRFHQAAEKQLQALWQAWKKAGLLDRILTWEGSFNPRFVRGSRSSLSNHAFGSAFDINYAWNKLGAEPAWVNEEGTVRELVPLANEHGFYWGGHYRSRLDGMHFEVAKIL